MSNVSGVRQYSYHNWSRYMVREPKNQPCGEHYAAVLFGTRTEWSPGYDKGDPDTTSSVPETTYFAFPTKELLTTWVAEATMAKMNFFCFHVAKIGAIEVRVVPNLSV